MSKYFLVKKLFKYNFNICHIFNSIKVKTKKLVGWWNFSVDDLCVEKISVAMSSV